MSAFHAILAFQDGDPTCSLHWIGNRLGHKGSEASLEDYVAKLISLEGFPPPLPHRAHGGRISRDVSYRRSQWIRAAVLQWLGDFMPPDLTASLEENAEIKAAQDMDFRAGNLHLAVNNDPAHA